MDVNETGRVIHALAAVRAADGAVAVAAHKLNAVDLACSLVEDVDDGWSVVVDYGVVLFLGFFLSHGSAFDDSWAGSVAAVR